MDVGDLAGRPGATKRLEVDVEFGGLGVEMAKVAQKPLHLDLRLDSIAEGIHVSGWVSGEVTLQCRRCVTGFGRDLRVPVGEVYVYHGEEEDYRVEGDRVDLEPMVRDAVVLDLPLNPLCREDCKGLCAVCGEDRNLRDCGHALAADARWEPLRGLRERTDREGTEG